MTRTFSEAGTELTDEACQVLAIDGGQSQIRVRHSAWASEIELDGVSRLEGDTVASVAGAVGRAWRQAGRPGVDRCVLGLTTAPTDEPSQRRLCEMVAAAVSARQVWLADDSVTAHAGALSSSLGRERERRDRRRLPRSPTGGQPAHHRGPRLSARGRGRSLLGRSCRDRGRAPSSRTAWPSDAPGGSSARALREPGGSGREDPRPGASDRCHRALRA